MGLLITMMSSVCIIGFPFAIFGMRKIEHSVRVPSATIQTTTHSSRYDYMTLEKGYDSILEGARFLCRSSLGLLLVWCSWMSMSPRLIAQNDR